MIWVEDIFEVLHCNFKKYIINGLLFFMRIVILVFIVTYRALPRLVNNLFRKNPKKMFPRYCMHSDICNTYIILCFLWQWIKARTLFWWIVLFILKWSFQNYKKIWMTWVPFFVKIELCWLANRMRIITCDLLFKYVTDITMHVVPWKYGIMIF